MTPNSVRILKLNADGKPSDEYSVRIADALARTKRFVISETVFCAANAS
jgi:hypothetical protein